MATINAGRDIKDNRSGSVPWARTPSNVAVIKELVGADGIDQMALETNMARSTIYRILTRSHIEDASSIFLHGFQGPLGQEGLQFVEHPLYFPNLFPKAKDNLAGGAGLSGPSPAMTLPSDSSLGTCNCVGNFVEK